MLKKIFAVALFATIIISCKSKSAFNYSEAIVAKENNIVTEIQESDKKIETFLNEQKYDSVAAVGAKTEKILQKTLEEIEAMKVPDAKEADNFRSACITAYKATRKIYSTVKDAGNAATSEEREKILQSIQKIVEDKNEAVKEMQAAQRKFASANGFKVQ